MKSQNLSNEKIIPARIREARVSRGYSLSDLANLIGVTSQAISQYELGSSKPSMTILLKMVETLNFPLNFFFKAKNSSNTEYSPSAVYFRSLKSTPKKIKDAYAYRVEWADEIYHYFKKYVKFPEVDLPDFSEILTQPEIDYQTIEKVALALRKYWNIEKSPMPNVVNLLQKKGFVICNIQFRNKKVDAFSQWLNRVPYIMLGTDNSTAVRVRFDLAHELGHLILHSDIDQESITKKDILDRIEDEAHYFAGAFLLPIDSFPEEVVSSSLDHLIYLKKRWKVAVSAIIKRCEKLDLFTESQIRYLNTQMTKRGYWRQEPFDDQWEIEKPYLLKQAVELLIDNNIAKPDEILYELAHHKEELDSLCFLPNNLLQVKSTPPQLALIKN